MNQAVFLVGGPGSGKDIILKEVLNEYDVKEFCLEQVNKVVKKFFKEIIVITANAYNFKKIEEAKFFLEDNGFMTSLIYVDVSDEVSRNRLIYRNMSEEIRLDKLIESKLNIIPLKNLFTNFYYFNNILEQDSEYTIENLNILKEDLRIGASLKDKRKAGILAAANNLKRTDYKQHKNVQNEIKAKKLSRTLSGLAMKFHNKKSSIVKKNTLDFKDRLKHESFKECPSIIEEYKKKRKEKANTTDRTLISPVKGSGIGPTFRIGAEGDYRLGGLGNVIASESYDNVDDFLESIDSPSCDIGFPGVEGNSSNKDSSDKNSSYEYKVNKKKTKFEKEPSKNEEVWKRSKQILQNENCWKKYNEKGRTNNILKKKE